MEADFHSIQLASSEITITIGVKMVRTLPRLNQHPWPRYSWKAELAASLSLDSPRFCGMASLKTTILGQVMVAEVANL
jgi:hypothetical protein